MIAADESEMIALGEAFSRERMDHTPLVIALVGDLGAGKTHFSKGLVKGFESPDPVTSPTFAIVNEYPGGVKPVFHFDFYRLDSPGEIEAVGWEEFLDQDGMIIVEWADKFPELLPVDTVWCRISIGSGDRRLIEVENPGGAGK